MGGRDGGNAHEWRAGQCTRKHRAASLGGCTSMGAQPSGILRSIHIQTDPCFQYPMFMAGILGNYVFVVAEMSEIVCFIETLLMIMCSAEQNFMSTDLLF